MVAKPQSKKIDICLFLLLILTVLTIALVVVGTLLNSNTLKAYSIFIFSTLAIFLASYIILITIHDLELKKITNKSFLYYKYNLHQYIYIPALFGLAFVVSLSLFIFCPNTVSTATITSINISLFSLLFAIFVFIIPRCRQNLENKKHVAADTKYSNELELKKSMGKIYKENQAYNSLAYIMTLTAIVFCISILSILIFGPVLFTQFVLYFSNIMCLYFIIKLLLVVNCDLLSDLEKLEKQLLKEEDAIKNINQKETK